MRLRIKTFFKNLDYRHYICAGITAIFVLLAVFVFPYALGRLGESLRDVGNSVVYYFTELFEIENQGNVTITDFSKMPLELPFNLPNTWEEFKESWLLYWQIFFTKDNFIAYWNYLGDLLYYDSRYILIFISFLFLFIVAKMAFPKKENNDYNKDSKPLIAWKRFERKAYVPVKRWVLSFVSFIAKNGVYWKLWLFIWAYNFNFITIFLEFIAFYLYFCVSFSILEIYTQIVKLFFDLSVVIGFIPFIGWICIAFVALNIVRRKIGYAWLNHMEHRDRGFINDRPIVLMVCGTMGKRKTTMITDMALSQEIMFRDKAFEKILTADLKFPFFPWINLENAIKHAMAVHYIYNLATCKQFAKSLRRAWLKGKEAAIFGYDYRRYGMEYNDKLSVVNLWKVIEDYTQLYFLYVIESSLLISNYSIRVDSVLESAGNFPLWNTELFRRDSRYIEAYSRHSHILDFDMLRLGRRIIENNKNANAFEFGVINITEIGKERGNNLELQEKKKKDGETNQKNDLFNAWLKLVRHSATVDNYPFVKVITDEQRLESWGADARDLCEIVHIDECSDMRLAMPFFSLGDLIIDWFLGRFSRKYYDYRFDRGDNTLPMYLYHGLAAWLNKYRTGIYNTFGYYKLNVLVENGTQDGVTKSSNYYLMVKKIFSRRFSTDAYSDYFTQKALNSFVGIYDLSEFNTEKATLGELLSENSYFFNDLNKIRSKGKISNNDKKIT